VFWLAVGLGVGVTVAVVATRWARRTADELPAAVGRHAVATGRDVGRLLKEAADEFRAGMTEKEAEIRATLGE